MGNLFDSLQDNAFDVTTNTMGYPATWQPAAGGPQQTATVLYNNDTQKYELSNMDNQPYAWRMEYRYPHFLGLKSSVDQNENEVVEITLPGGETEFYVRRIDTAVDGKTFIAYLEPA